MKNQTISILLAFLLISLAFTSCKSSHIEKKVIKTVETVESIETENSEYKWKTGIITMSPFINKVGEVMPEYAEHYFLCSKGEYFIKLMDCKKVNADVKGFANKYVKIRVSFQDGLWDTNDPNVQSRVGPYVVYDSIIEIDEPVKIIYSDGSGNSYKIEPNSIIYTPVKPAESSSGTYSGGNAINIEIDIEQFNEIFIRSEKLMTNKDIQSKNREMGTGSMKVTFSNSEMKAIIMKGQKLQLFQAYLDSIIIQIN